LCLSQGCTHLGSVVDLYHLYHLDKTVVDYSGQYHPLQDNNYPPFLTYTVVVVAVDP